MNVLHHKKANDTILVNQLTEFITGTVLQPVKHRIVYTKFNQNELEFTLYYNGEVIGKYTLDRQRKIEMVSIIETDLFDKIRLKEAIQFLDYYVPELFMR